MAVHPDPDRPIKLLLTLQGDAPQLLAGLEALLHLGLLSDAQVKQLSQQHFTCAVPEPVVAQPAPESLALDLVPASPASSPGLVVQGLQSLMAEISVLWLLFLGVFLVVVSSAVLAASQWKHVPPEGQYSILLAYTLAFWVAATWTGRRPDLGLTARMLQITTLLIIPVNFWMMDGFKLWATDLGRIVGIVATLSLTGVNVLLLRSATGPLPKLTLLNSIGLSWLHWGWSLPGFPLGATYIGTIGTALSLFYRHESTTRSTEVQPEPDRSPNLGLITLTITTLLLIGRAILMARVPVSELGLALGICGWLLCWLARHDFQRRVWSQAGVGLMLVGWGVSIGTPVPWQAIGVSVLGLWLLADRLLKNRRPIALTAFFLVGLQTYVLLRQLIPEERRQTIVAFCIQQVGEIGMPDALPGIALFPYLWLTLLAVDWLRRREYLPLVQRTERLALLLGIGMTLASSLNQTVLAINLSLTTVTLALVIWKRAPLGDWLIYLTHVLGLAAIATWIDVLFPELDQHFWAALFLAGMVIEWGVTALGPWTRWRRSAWILGLVLAGIGYQLLIDRVSDGYDWGWMWLVAPASLTTLAYRSRFPPQIAAAWFSTVGLVALQVLTVPTAPLRILGLGTATILMLLNMRQLQHLLAAVVTIGLGLSFGAVVLWEILTEQGEIPFGVWLLIQAIAVLGLWLFRLALLRRDNPLSLAYRLASDGWAIVISGITLQWMTLYSLGLYLKVFSPELPDWRHLTAATVLTGAIALRTLPQGTNLGYFGLAWGLETVLLQGIALLGPSIDRLAMGNLALGLGLQLLGDFWMRRFSSRIYPASWHIIPLLYGLLGFMLQHRDFTATTGLFTLGLALIGIGIGRRLAANALTYLSLLAVSVGAYELLIYQLQQAKGGSAGDGLVLLAILAVTFAIGFRLMCRRLATFLRLTEPGLRAWGYLHWAFATALLLMALTLPLSVSGGYLWSGTLAATALYGLLQGRMQPGTILSFPRFWTYAGIAAAVLSLSGLLYLVTPDKTGLEQWAGAIAGLFALPMYSLPWGRWGWPVSPWRRSAAGLPLLVTLPLIIPSSTLSLLLVATFYAWLARASGRLRLSYVGVLLADYVFLRILEQYQLTDPLWFAAIVGGSLLFVAQVDPYLQAQPEREKRHWLRCLAIGLIAFTAFYQSDRSDLSFSSLALSGGTIGFAIGLVLAGLALRVRAFLYVGTALFILKVLRQLWLFIDNYALVLWAILGVLGLLFILVAANFEARRSQFTALLRYWVDALSTWE
ncbi:hypothetical protein BST81_15445 [Leptolyngbya sp. 'hensonii']|uniref:hypothetical protein n=1 Tax=Leptolyngbya sp. 'hensonii' TaxID=1922337 RepID=UPI00094FF9C4|nr:hypothetical protein [Leptolyngbya sp. 'hensonii']OLP17711.1 hypothetical protein BST81_15445 [Leptolyngbya sp. 'hensonii']